MRYHCDGYTEEYLSGGEINVAYNPDDVTIVWALIGGQYVAFDLVERRYNGKNVEEAQILRDSQKTLILGKNRKSTQAKIDLARYIETIANNVCHKSDVKVKDIRQTRKHETQLIALSSKEMYRDNFANEYEASKFIHICSSENRVLTYNL